jgi:serine-type D-Ala-D-Ala carboxypeptidase (penicillin-binding protein 5/6)
MQRRTVLKMFAILSLSFVVATGAQASSPEHLTAPGIAVYGWKDGKETALFVKNEHRLYPIASITKLITAKVALSLYPEKTKFTITPTAAATSGTISGIVPGAVFSRNDLLTALLVRSSNDAATALAEPVGMKYFLQKMNEALHTGGYTSRSFINPSGLDPERKERLLPNRMTPFHLSELVSDIYTQEPLLRKFLSYPSAQVIDTATGAPVTFPNTNPLFRNDAYKSRILLSKTGTTDMAKHTMAFVTDGGGTYDYVTVVILGSKNKSSDATAILDWLGNN